MFKQETNGLKQELDQYFEKYELNDFGWLNFNVWIDTSAYEGTYEDITDCVEDAVREYGELDIGKSIGPDTDVRSLITVKETNMYGFAREFLLKDIIVSSYLDTERGFEPIIKQMNAVLRMGRIFGKNGIRVFSTGVPFGYLAGGVFVFLKEETNEIAVASVYGSD